MSQHRRPVHHSIRQLALCRARTVYCHSIRMMITTNTIVSAARVHKTESIVQLRLLACVVKRQLISPFFVQEIAIYLSCKKMSDPLAFWLHHQGVMPNLAACARIVFALMPSSCSPERAFSAGRALTVHAECTLCLRCRLRYWPCTTQSGHCGNASMCRSVDEIYRRTQGFAGVRLRFLRQTAPAHDYRRHMAKGRVSIVMRQ